MDKAKSSFNTEKGILKILRRGGGEFEYNCCVVTHRAADIRAAWLGLALRSHVLRAYCNFESKQTNLGDAQIKRKALLMHANENEVHALARLTFYENLLVGQESSVCCPH